MDSQRNWCVSTFVINEWRFSSYLTKVPCFAGNLLLSSIVDSAHVIQHILCSLWVITQVHTVIWYRNRNSWIVKAFFVVVADKCVCVFGFQTYNEPYLYTRGWTACRCHFQEHKVKWICLLDSVSRHWAGIVQRKQSEQSAHTVWFCCVLVRLSLPPSSLSWILPLLEWLHKCRPGWMGCDL